jgi:hypothetical protein
VTLNGGARAARRWPASNGGPVTVKDNLFVRGMRATWGSPLHAVRNTVTEPCSSGHTEGQISRLEMLDRVANSTRPACFPCSPAAFRE